ncbi:MAG: 3-dehydroquinate synthase [Candidatus Westeberhardia cardiocondylae]|nr:3-dehydroquinate synthase [Candidatus Westeberhardia cardiocondylae]
MEKVFVNLKDRSYPIIVAFGLFSKFRCFVPLVCDDRVMIITNECLAGLYLQKFREYLVYIGIQVDHVVLPDGEQYKSLKILDKVCYSLLKKNHGRDTTVVSFGGGVIGDLSGFVASVYKRGVRLVHVPTTLLSQVDASIGGKTGVNHQLGKNMIGTFYQPSSVLIELDYLRTLPRREFSAGLAEIVKYAVIFDSVFFSWLEDNLEYLFSLDVASVTYCVRECCKFKANVVMCDEYEKNDQRVLLNFGHTYGHAIESCMMKYGTWLHGEAISVGMMMAMYTSYYLGHFSIEDLYRVKELFVRAKLPVCGPKEMLPEDYLSYMVRDKKNFHNLLKLVLPVSLGSAKVFSGIDSNVIYNAITSCSAK